MTGAVIPEVLRVSHAEPWAECVLDTERLDVFNGLLLIANLDALFNRFLISFDERGEMMFPPALVKHNLRPLGIALGMRLRGINIAGVACCFFFGHFLLLPLTLNAIVKETKQFDVFIF